MSYRSNVVIITKNDIIQEELNDNICLLADRVMSKDGWSLYYFDSIKWETDFSTILEIKSWMRNIEDVDDYTFINLNDDTGIFEETGNAQYLKECPFHCNLIKRLDFGFDQTTGELK